MCWRWARREQGSGQFDGRPRGWYDLRLCPAARVKLALVRTLRRWLTIARCDLPDPSWPNQEPDLV
jgi:hypothetical protein